MEIEVLDIYDLGDNLNAGNINVNEEINKITIEYLSTSQSYIEKKKLKTCVEFLEGIISNFASKEPFEYILFMTIKIYCNLRLHNYRYVSNDLNLLENLDGENYKFQKYPLKYKKENGSMVPFLLRLINCYYPYTLGLFFTSFDRLYLLLLQYEKLMNKIRNENACTDNKVLLDKANNNISSPLFKHNRQIGIIFHYITIISYILCDLLLKKNYIEQAIELLKEKILKYFPNHINTLSLIGKLFLFIGSFDFAESYFNMVKNIVKYKHLEFGNKDTYPIPSLVNSNMYGHSQMNFNFLYLYLEEYEIALKELLNINEYFIIPINNNDNNNNNRSRNNVASDYAIYYNNLSITSMFNGDLKNSIQHLENVVTTNYVNVFPSIVQNLNDIYKFTKTKSEIINHTNDTIKKNLEEDQEILALLP
ncbi:conserved Plasmodium protein, unknown function [Plasmodium berghei]|uniref:Uncharacterized protein n=2 Tax=Plasmodium berghei TaxID=5821 RepID=A0A509AW15_PLABA|nr:conserved protein, unknown function [Plasmodium berghei ANKA]CXJ25913.1 conserved Plasmodium protein, unknown function [Plasmodium berghei]SCM26893.1 conserved Plasmodium protein, unknown function [Plasmodium berghei]SCN28689.1 conserved Plasmodium protein, unknown function [Plasmodium berghei]SCO62923.1 conserved Plasmodium protein, unknown function [Plasmodium berghei]SCO64437.1 conserved Plasmodium protein, unknown function [Plasmodium berghei]|eukprot:XP_034424334.1 conserved protein, unknown function [Plasmodium berghei ANKA]